MKKYIVALAVALIATTSFAAEIPLKLLRQVPETVTASTFDFIGQTDADVTAVICGKQVPVYQTGAFGDRIALKDGSNEITVTLTKGRKTRTEKYVIIRRAATPTPSVPQEVEQFRDTLFYAQTLEGAYLQYGDGSDRLGGSKAGYLEPGIPVKIVAVRSDLSKVQLSDHEWAYISPDYIQSSDVAPVTVNSGTISISPSNDYDVIAVSLPQRVPYISWDEADPAVIRVNLYGVTNNSNWITHKRGLGIVESVDARQIESDVLQLVIRLQNGINWGYTFSFSGQSLRINVKHAPAVTSLKGLKVGLDAGHGGSAPGAVSPTGINESEVNLSIVYELKSILESKGAIVTLSRTDDSSMEMSERKKIFKDAGIDVMISIHNNAGGSPFVAMGTSTYYKHMGSRQLAYILREKMLELDGVNDYGLTGNFNFSLCAPTEYPSALVECLFMSSLPDEEKIADKKWHHRIAEKVAAGLEEYIGQVCR